MVAPDKEFLLIVVQGPKGEKKEENEWPIIYKINQNI